MSNGTKPFAAIGAAFLALTAHSAQAGLVVAPQIGPIETELVAMSLSGSGTLPLGRDQSGGNEGYQFVQSSIAINESATIQSLGQAILHPTTSPVQNGDPIFVQSFFDVFFDVTITDIDPVHNFWGPSGEMPHGSPLSVPGIGPAPMVLGGANGGGAPCIADTSQPNYGCLPPVGDVYIGHFKIPLDLPWDINGNGLNDSILFTLATHNVGNVTNAWIVGVNAFDTFNTTLDLSGAVQDQGTDPPFGPITLTGPTTASQNILVPGQVPEPASLAMLGLGLGLLGLARRRR